MRNRNRPEAKAENDLKIILAENDERLSSAAHLINTRYSERGYASSHKIERADRQITLCASWKESIVGTVTLNVDSEGGMLADQIFRDQIDVFRNNGAKVCEITKLAVDRTARSQRTLAQMFHTLYIYARYLYGCTHFFIEVNPRHQRFYETVLGFRSQCEVRENSRVKAPACLLWLDLDEFTKKMSSFRTIDKNRDNSRKSFYSCWFSPEKEAYIANAILQSR